MRKLFITLTFAFLILPDTVECQTEIGFTFPEGSKKIEIPIDIVNNLIIVPVTVNRFLPLHFVLDTGVETAILTEPDYSPLISPDFVRKITIVGAGVQDSITAYVGQKMTYELPGGIIGRNMNILVLDDDYLNLDERLGREVQGIIGYDIFKRFVVEIDYDNKVLKLFNPPDYRPSRWQTMIPIEVKNGRSFIKTKLSNNQTTDTVTFMIDSGASHAILLDASQSKIESIEKTIETNLGTGLGGEIPGKIGRLDHVEIGKYSFRSVLASLPEENAYGKSIKRGSRQGTLGGEILSRFNPVFDYSKEKLYLTKGSHHKAPFEYDMSGLGLVARGTFLDTLVVDYVHADSPAEQHGVKVGDIVLSVNGLNLEVASLNAINSLLKRRPKKKVKLRILRDGRKNKIVFRLRRAI